MKKVIFAVVLLAGMGTQLNAKNVLKKVKVVRAMTCLDKWMPEYDSLIASGYTDSQAQSIADSHYRACLK